MRLLSIAFIVLLTVAAAFSETNTNPIAREAVVGAEKLIGLDFSDAKIDQALPGLKEQLDNFEAMRRFPLSNGVPPALQFNPLPVGFKFETARKRFKASSPRNVNLPAKRDDLAFYSVGELAALLKTRQISSEELTRFYLDRLKRYGPKLEGVVTLTESLALQQASRADREIAAGKYRGPLHGIPYGAKDLLAVKGIRTTWGAAPYTNQIFDFDATVIKRLEAAGAVLVAKTTLGELAMGETWFGGMTRNPWNLKQGSSGSSAGSVAGTAAGLFAFGIGSETLGSIVSPCDRCGVTGLRPTYGRVSRVGAMALSWSMDKLGPVCRTVEDCALVFNAIYGPDGRDETTADAPFVWNADIPLSKLRIAYVKNEFDPPPGPGRGGRGAEAPPVAGAGAPPAAGDTGRGRGGLTPEEQQRLREARLKIFNDVLDVYRKAGATLQPVDIPETITKIAGMIAFVLTTEGAAAFDDLTRSKDINDPSLNTWPNAFRTHRFVPAVEYIRAQRARTLLIREMDKFMSQYDVFLSPTGSATLGVTNLTGHPAVALKAGFIDNRPIELMVTGRLYDEATMLRVALAFERGTDWHLKNPVL